jgi:hypothetical protein
VLVEHQLRFFDVLKRVVRYFDYVLARGGQRPHARHWPASKLSESDDSPFDEAQLPTDDGHTLFSEQREENFVSTGRVLMADTQSFIIPLDFG